jgi:hypothetical protein
VGGEDDASERPNVEGRRARLRLLLDVLIGVIGRRARGVDFL